MDDALEFLPARTPRTLWLELTSKCPFDCIFCSRQVRRGAGVHLPFAVYSSLLDALVDPRKFILNYSGESTVYPDLIPAIQRARATGAFVEMVSVLATMPESLLGPLSQSGLNRLTVSVHATDPEKFAEIYRHSSFTSLRSRLERLVELCRATPGPNCPPPVVDLAFVAMDANLTQLSSVASFANALGLRDITIFPVMRRDEIPARFAIELTPGGVHRPEFEKRVQAVVNTASQSHPEIRFTVCNEGFTATDRRLGEVPVPYPWELPSGALIHSCEQNPWETTHVLSNGDVVACEVLDKIPLGNLFKQPIDEIWHGAPYQGFRARYRRGQVPECRTPWKRAYRPSPRAPEIVAARGLSAQLLYGWHEPTGEAHIWSSQQSAAVLTPRPGSQTLHVSGMLPPGPGNNPNDLTIRLNGTEIGRVTNPWDEIISFGLDFVVAANPQERANQQEFWMLEFRTTHVYRPSERGTGSDQRDLGFALVLVVSKTFADPARARAQSAAVQPPRRLVRATDLSARLRRRWHRTPRAQSGETWSPGLSILIPEWDNAEELELGADVRRPPRAHIANNALAEREPMSHHFDTKLAREDPSLNLCDFYLFDGPSGKTVMAMTEHTHIQPFVVRKATGDDALRGDAGESLVEGETGSVVTNSGLRAYVGIAPELFAANAGFGRFMTAFYKGQRYDGDAFLHQQNPFARRNVTAIVLEVPSELIGKGKINAWTTISLFGHAPEVQVSRWGLPMVTHIFLNDPSDQEVKEQFNASVPSEDLERFAKPIADFAEKMTTYADSAADPGEYGKLIAARLCPNTLPYELGTSAAFEVASFNGRALGDDVLDVMLTLAANTPIVDGLAPDRGRIRKDFPYYGAPYTAEEQVGVTPMPRPAKKRAGSDA